MRINAPKGAVDHALRLRIAQYKDHLLALVRRRESRSPGVPASWQRLPDNQPSPLSFAQERLWFLEQLEPGRSIYNLCRAVRIAGELDLYSLEQSLNAIVERHQALRTKFLEIDGRPLQVVGGTQPIALTPVDLRRYSSLAREQQVARRLLKETQRPFDLTAGRLLRSLLLRLSDAEHVLALSTHHMVADAWSMGILFRDLWIYYEAFSRGGAPALPVFAIQYRDYAAWQREVSGTDASIAQVAYWRKQLAALTVLDLPTDRPRPARQSYRGARQKIDLSESLTAALNELSRREGVTLFMTLLAAFQVLLYRYSGQEDIAVGAPAASRDGVELEELVGLFVNTVVYRSSLGGAPSFKTFLRHVRKVCLDANAHRDVPFEKLVVELNPRRELDRQPLFQAMFVLQNTPIRSNTPAGLKLTPLEIANPASPFDLSLYLRERGGRLTGFFEYAVDLFDEATLERLAGHFEKLLEGIAVRPEQSIVDLPLLTEGERRQILVDWNATAAAYPRDACIHQLFEAQVERTPRAGAFECAGQRLTFHELNHRANRLGRYLRNFGVGPESVVGVLADRSIEMIVSLLAVLKAGGAYLPLDPAYPKDRLAFMLQDAKVKTVLYQKKLAHFIANFSGAALAVDNIPLDEYSNSANLDHRAAPDSAAYVIYTSGSAGTAKAVIGLHRGAVNRFAWMWRAYPFAPGEVACQKTSLSFVDSVWEIFGALLQGVPTTIVPDAISKEPQKLVRYLGERKVTRMVAVPTLLRAMLDQCADAGEQLKYLTLCVSSGETLSAQLARRFRARLPNCRLINLYGSSEVSADVACYEVGANIGECVPIGRPIHNTQIYLLDTYMQPVPIGVTGELYIGGDNLGRGYLHRPELTTENFIANPFAPHGGPRLYRTGDRGRYRTDGNIEFLGRADNQVKIRGSRVELGEVEFALLQHPEVKECAVIAVDRIRIESPLSRLLRPGSGQASPVKGEGALDSDRHLIAYIVASADKPLTTELVSFLKKSLPIFMVPSSFAWLDALPLLPNGKVDRRALTTAETGGFISPRARTEPRTEIEALVAQVWRKTLNIGGIGVSDNFFELGGHSLLAAQMTANLRAASGAEVSLRDVFEAPTVEGLAAKLKASLRSGSKAELPSIGAAPRQRWMPLSPSQERLFSFAQLLGGDFLNMPYAYRLNGVLDLPALRRVVQEIVRRHEALRTGFVETDDGPRQFVRTRAYVKVPVIDLSPLTAERRDERFEQLSHCDARLCFDLEKPPLIRVKVVRLGEQRHVLLVTMHHIVTDQWSMGVFRQELAALYEAFSQGQPSPLPELPFQFRDFVAWQRRIVADGHLARQIAHWRKQLSGPRGDSGFHRGAGNNRKARFGSTRKSIEADEGLMKKIKNIAAGQAVTPFMVFVAALKLLMYHASGRDDVRVATLSANRGQAKTGGLIGYFVNTLILRTRVSPRITCNEFLRQVREVCLTAYANADVPVELLEAALHNCRRGSAAPLYRVMFNYRSLSTPPLIANGLTIASWDGKHRAGDPGVDVARLDVNFNLRELSTKLTGTVNFRTDLFRQDGMDRFLRNYFGILNQIVMHPERRISRVEID